MSQTRQLKDASGNHTVQICLTENSQIDSVTHYIKDGLLNGEGVFIIAKRSLGKNLRLKMGELSFDGLPLQDQNQIRFFDAEILLLYMQSDEYLEEEAFQRNIAVPVINAQSEYKKVRVFSQMGDILCKQGQHDRVIQLTSYWEDLASTQKLSLLCIYSLNELSLESYHGILKRICRYHLRLTPQEYDDLIEQETGEEIRLKVFGTAWNRVIKKLAH